MAGPIDLDFTLGPVIGLIFLAALAAMIFDIWMLVDAIGRPPELYPTPDQKALWVVGLIVGLVTGLPALAVAIAYYIIVRKPAAGRVAAYPAAMAPAPPGATPAPLPAPTAKPVHCSSCGTKLNAGARFCHSCGAPV